MSFPVATFFNLAMIDRAAGPVHSRWFNTAVVALWLVTMTWLVREKVLPQLLVGDRPSNLDILRAQWDAPPVGWQISMDNQQLGWALTEGVRQTGGLTELHGRIHLSSVPLEKILPGWLQPFVRLWGKPGHTLRLDALDACTTLTVDALGNLVRLDSAMRIDPLDETISVRGAVEGSKMELLIIGGEKSFPCAIPMPPKSLLTDMLSPQSELPGLHDGQSWSTPVYNPLSASPSSSPVEIIFVTVEGREQKIWGGKKINAWRVVYRSEPHKEVGNDKDVRGFVWVRSDGMVIQQQVRMSGSVIDFFRMPRPEAAKLVETVGPQWWNEIRLKTMRND